MISSKLQVSEQRKSSSKNSEKKNHKIANTLKIMKITLYFFLVWLFAFQNEKRHNNSKLL